MKKIVFLAFTFFGINAIVAQTNTAMPNNASSETPTIVSNHFSIDYPGTSPTWTMWDNSYMATYHDNKTNTDRFTLYDQNGIRTGYGERLSSGSYPGGIGDYYTKKYPNETYEVWSSDDGLGNKSYYTDRNSERIWFDKDGKYKNKTKNRSKTKNAK